MPFISKDWRSPGEEWVKTQEGWEMKKVLECTAHNYPAITNCNNTADTEHKSWSGPRAAPPHCRLVLGRTREVAGRTALAEAVRRLDLVSALRDVRRVHYTCALLELLLAGPRLALLPARAQRLLLSVLEHLAAHVSRSQQNLKQLRALVASATAARDEASWGRALGSRSLWDRHHTAIDRISHVAHSIRIVEPGPEVIPKLHDLPDECIREILLRLSDYRDLEAASEAWSRMTAVCSERRTWRELVSFHFSELQQRAAGVNAPLTAPHWKALFHQLRRRYGERGEAQLADALSLCRHCSCLYWRSLGHPCIADQCPEYRERLKQAGGPLPPHPVPPAEFLKLFSL